ncbi:AI-2E family transporter [Butyrivibrio proteoclasticus]|uniref:AI-2E family transporter n=1 Tax=Butyrivibrio proteoclasticus TaxID=43305 RepID=UPI00047CCC97|nr:AI-2E family transporter [Butyrivibrio proteoclasticus]
MKLNNKWFKKKWVSYTIATCSAVILYMLLSHIGTIGRGISGFYQFIKPVVSGIIVAYVFNPISKLYDNHIFKRMKNEKNRWRLSVACTIITILLFVSLLGAALIPQLIDSTATLASNMSGYIESSQELLKQFEGSTNRRIFGISFAQIAEFAENSLSSIGDYFGSNMDSFVATSASIGKGVFDGVLAFILAIYLLLDKHRIIEGFSKLMALILKEDSYEKSAIFAKRCNEIIIRYISFDIIDGIIVGIANFIYMLVAGLPYSVLISVIVGVTNLAPTFGPIVGAVIGGFILVLVNPWYALWFIIFTLILQTVDGYVLKPRLFGESLGVSPLMILIAIILGGRLFGVMGILIAIPFAAILDFTWKDYLLKRLEQKRKQG